MKRIIPTALLLSAVACSAADQGELQQTESESVGQGTEALNGALLPTGPLTRRNFVRVSTGAPETDESTRQNDTLENYYKRVRVNPFQSNDTIFNRIGTLAAFKNKYFNGVSGFLPSNARYYNRGDLGLGRDMHCVEAEHSEIACYVTNYVSAPLKANGDFSEFSFGLSSKVAFDNMLAGHAVATVAMVFQPGTGQDKVIFMVYDGVTEKLVNAAPLDRHGLNYANEFKYNLHPGPEFGQPGVNFNNHIPSNCLNCHGGTYDSNIIAHGKVKDAYFLPFDLDQFEFLDAPGWRRDDPANKAAFRELNQSARRVAYRHDLDGTNQTLQPNHPIVKQIDGWYGNTSPTNEVLSGDFNSNYVPPGWVGKEAAYRGFIRPACRGCHMAAKSSFDGISFDEESKFRTLSGIAAQRVSDHSMAHALQTQRQFWQSSQNFAFLDYLTANKKDNPTALSTLQAANAGTGITLDPHLINAVAF